MPEITCHTLFSFIHINFVLRVRKKREACCTNGKKYCKPSQIFIFCGLSYSFNLEEHILFLLPLTLPKVNFHFLFFIFSRFLVSLTSFVFKFAFEERFMKLLVRNMTHLWCIYKSWITNILFKRVCVKLNFVSWCMSIFSWQNKLLKNIIFWQKCRRKFCWFTL